MKFCHLETAVKFFDCLSKRLHPADIIETFGHKKGDEIWTKYRSYMYIDAHPLNFYKTMESQDRYRLYKMIMQTKK